MPELHCSCRSVQPEKPETQSRSRAFWVFLPELFRGSGPPPLRDTVPRTRIGRRIKSKSLYRQVRRPIERVHLSRASELAFSLSVKRPHPFCVVALGPPGMANVAEVSEVGVDGEEQPEDEIRAQMR